MPDIKYEVSIAPAEPELKASIQSSSPTRLTLAADSLQDFSVKLQPTGSWGDRLLSSIVKPVADIIMRELPDQAQSAIKATTHDMPFQEPLGIRFSVEGVDVKIEAQTLDLTNHDGMLLATGTVKVI